MAKNGIGASRCQTRRQTAFDCRLVAKCRWQEPTAALTGTLEIFSPVAGHPAQGLGLGQKEFLELNEALQGFGPGGMGRTGLSLSGVQQTPLTFGTHANAWEGALLA